MDWKALIKAILTIPFLLLFILIFIFICDIFPHIWTCLLVGFILYALYRVYKGE